MYDTNTSVQSPDMAGGVVLLADGDFPSTPYTLDILHGARYLCCTDGAGKALIDRLGIMPDAIVGDGDSLPQEFKDKYHDIIHIVDEQEYNDLTKCVRHIVSTLSPLSTPIYFLGCTGKREDHTIGNISLMAYYRREMGIRAVMVTDYGTFVPASGEETFCSFARQQISIFNLSSTRLTSDGLRWDAYPYQMWWQGTLNESLADKFTIHADGEYIIYRTHEAKVMR